MTWHRTVLTILRKELREGLRDPKTLLLNYVVPLVIYPLFGLWAAEVVAVRLTKHKETIQTILVITPFDEALRKELTSITNVRLKDITVKDLERLGIAESFKEGANEEQTQTKIRTALRAEKATAIVSCSERPASRLRLMNRACDFHYDASDWLSVLSEEEIEKASARFEKKQLSLRFAALNLKSDAIEPFKWRSINTAETARVVSSELGELGPTLFMLIFFMVSFYPAINTTVGERERGTMATLLSLPITPSQLITGKFLSVLFFAFLGAISYFGPPALLFLLTKGSDFSPTKGFVLPNSPWAFLAVAVSAGLMITSMSICVGFLGRKLSEAQGYFTALLLVPLLPLLASFAAPLQLDSGTAAVPLLNLSLTLKTMVVDPVSPLLLLEVLFVNLLLTAACLALTVHLVRAEYRGDPNVSDLLTFNRKAVRVLSPAFSTVLFTISLLCVLYLNMSLTRLPVLALICLTHIGVLTGLPFAATKYFRISPLEAFRLHRPSWRALAGAMITGFSLPIVFSAFLSHIELPKEIAEEAANKLFPAGSSLWMALLTIAIIPAITEELFFRGPVLRGLERGFPKGWAVLLCAGMFAVMHMSAFRMLPTFLAGLLLGYAAIRTRSIFPGMLIHLLNNGLATFAAWASRNGMAGALEGELPASLGFAALAALAVGMLLLHLDGKAQEPPTTRAGEVSKAA